MDERIHDPHRYSCNRLSRSRRNSSGSNRTPRYCTQNAALIDDRCEERYGPHYRLAPLPRTRRCCPRNDVDESASKFAPNLVEEPPVGSIRDDFRRARFHHPSFAQTKRVKTHCVFGIVLTPVVVRHVRKSLSRIVASGREAPIYHTLRNKGRFVHAQIRRPEHGAKQTLGSDGIFSYKFAIPGQHAAKILRPWAILRAVDDDMSDVLRTQPLWFWRKSEEGVDLALSEQLDRFDRCARHPLDILGGIESNESRHRAEENVGACLKRLDAYGSTLQIGDAAYALLGE